MGRIHNIEGRKNKQDAKKANIFTKYARLIQVAAREGGADIEYNPALKNAVDKAKAMNMPNDNIDRAIKKGSGASDQDTYEHITYEGYAPGGIAVIVNTLTDNKNRTAGNIRYYFDKNGGNLGTQGCVSFMFERKGEIIIEKTDNIDNEELMEFSLELDIEDFIEEDDCYVIYTSPENYNDCKISLEEKGYIPVSADVKLIPNTYQDIEQSKRKSFDKLLEFLEDDDDVQEVYHNANLE